jgi:hypothetical protein
VLTLIVLGVVALFVLHDQITDALKPVANWMYRCAALRHFSPAAR